MRNDVHSLCSRRRRLARALGMAYVEVLVIVAVVLALGAGAVLALGGASKSKAKDEAQCITSFNCSVGDSSGTGNGGNPTTRDLGSAAVAAPSTWDDVVEAGRNVGRFGYGVGAEAVDTVVGTYQAVRHPIQTVQGIGFVIAHPVTTWNAIHNEWAGRSTAENLGRGVFEVVSLIGPGAATKITRAAAIATDAERAATEAARLAEVARAAEATRVAEAERAAATAANTERRVGSIGEGTPVGEGAGEQPIPNSRRGEYHGQAQGMSCGMACTRMVVQDVTGTNFPESMIRQAATKYGFSERNGIPFANLPEVLREFGTNPTISGGARTGDIARAVSSNERVIAEVQGHVIVVDGVTGAPGQRIFNIRDPNPRIGRNRITEQALGEQLQGGMIEIPLPR